MGKPILSVFVIVVLSPVLLASAQQGIRSGITLPPEQLKEHPGKPYIDVWGWFSPIYYQAKDPNGVTLEYLEKLALHDTYPRGANLFFLWPPHMEWWANYNRGYPLLWRDDDPWKRPDGYLKLENPNWTHDYFKQLVRDCHEKGFLITFGGNYPFIQLKDENSRTGYQAGSFFTDEKLIKENLYVLQWICRNLSNPLEQSYRDCLDGFFLEVWFTGDRKGRTSEALWQYNPGGYLEFRGGSYPGTWPTNPAPNLVQNFSYGIFPGWQPSFKDSALHAPTERVFTSFEGNCRLWAYPPNKMGSNHFGKDFIINMTNYQFRQRAREQQDIHSSGLWWLSVLDHLFPLENKAYVYAMSQDPIKAAVCAPTANKINVGAQGSILAIDDTDFPKGTFYIQNNHFRLYIHKDRDGAVLQVDKDVLAKFTRVLKLPEEPLRLSEARRLFANHANSYFNVEGYITQYLAHPVEKEFEIVEPGGYLSILKEKRQQEIQGTNKMIQLKEERLYTVINDSPFLLVDINRQVEKNAPGTVILSVGADGYDTLLTSDGSYQTDTTMGVYDYFTLRDSTSERVELTYVLIKPGLIKKVSWIPYAGLYFESNDVENEQIRIALVIGQVLPAEKMKDYVLSAIEAIKMSNGQVRTKNELDIPTVKALRVSNASEGPYYVKEYGWWMFRGTQESKQFPGQTYVKAYLQPNGEAVITDRPYILDTVRPGWGCQYLLAFKDIEKKAETVKCLSRVTSVTPYVYAPRIQFALDRKPITKAKLNGQDWNYFEDDIIFLPNIAGTYKVEVSNTGKSTPHLLRTFALIEKCYWQKQKNTLTFTVDIPVWSTKMPGDLKFTGVINKVGRTIKSIKNAEIIRESNMRALLRFSFGTVEIVFE